MDALADVNWVFAVVNVRHGFHRKACRWLDSQEPGFRVGICRIVQMALIRLLSNAAAMDGDPLPLPAAWKVYADLIADPAFCFFPEPAGFQTEWILLCQPYGPAPKVVNDAYLAALSKTAGIPLLTFDKDFRHFPGLLSVLGG